MARYDIGKLKLNFSRQGFAFKWGDGHVHRLRFPGGNAEEEPRTQARAPRDRYDYDSDYAPEDDYDDADSRYPDEGRRYSSRYDYDTDYGEPEDYPPEDYADELDEAPAGGLAGFLAENDWPTLLLLVLLPPVGIYLLWWRRRYQMPLRAGLSVAAAVWFLLLLFWLIPKLLSGGGDPVAQQGTSITLTTQAPVAVDAFTDTADAAATPEPAAVEPNATVGATPLPGSTSEADEYVYSPATGSYYHAREDCPEIPAGTVATAMTVNAAANRGQTACPVCFAEDLYYATANGTHYHLDPTCSNMVNPELITKQNAEAQGKTACPICVEAAKAASEDTGENVVITPYTGILTGQADDQSGVTVWATVNGAYYHTAEHCSGMNSAVEIGLLTAIKAGKTACPTCCAAAGTTVWCTRKGTYCHSKSDCSGMSGASQMTYAEALVLGKARCPVCLSGGVSAAVGGGTVAAAFGETDASGIVYVYATKGGKYYHTKSDCSGMRNATRVPLATVVKAKRPPCPTCASAALQTVYANKGGTYYHSQSSCRNMSNAPATTLAEALASGKQRCPYCWGVAAQHIDARTAFADSLVPAAPATWQEETQQANASAKAEIAEAAPVAAQAVEKNLTAEAPAEEIVETAAAAEPTEEAVRTADAAKAEEAPAFTLASLPSINLWTASAESIEVEAPVVKASVSGAARTAKAADEKSYVYADPDGKRYHVKNDCSSLTGGKRLLLSEALTAGLTACRDCAAAADKTVYGSADDAYYHADKAHAGTGAVKGTLAQAMAKGLKACPACTGSNAAKIGTAYETGASGITVFATPNGKYYHRTADCSHMKGAQEIALETALNYGKAACPICATAGGRTVYAVKGDPHYHLSAAHAGTGAKSGTTAQALALGLTPCTDCAASAGH